MVEGTSSCVFAIDDAGRIEPLTDESLKQRDMMKFRLRNVQEVLKSGCGWEFEWYMRYLWR